MQSCDNNPVILLYLYLSKKISKTIGSNPCFFVCSWAAYKISFTTVRQSISTQWFTESEIVMKNFSVITKICRSNYYSNFQMSPRNRHELQWNCESADLRDIPRMSSCLSCLEISQFKMGNSWPDTSYCQGCFVTSWQKPLISYSSLLCAYPSNLLACLFGFFI